MKNPQFLLVLSVLGSALSVTAESSLPSMKAICANEKVTLTTREHLLKLAEEFKQSPEDECRGEIRSAVLEHGEILSEPDENFCTVNVTQRIRNFYFDYIDDTIMQHKIQADGRKPLPVDLKKFALALGHQVSRACEGLMITAFGSSESDIAIDDWNSLGGVLRSDGRIHSIMEKVRKVADIPLPADFALLSKHPIPLEKIYIQTNAARTIRDIQNVCANRFQPIYEPPILPLSILGSAGYFYRDSDNYYVVTSESYTTKAKRWSKIVFVCEGAKLVEAIDEQDEGDLKDNPFHKFQTRVKVISKDEADAIKQKSGASVSQPLVKVTKVHFDLSDRRASLSLGNAIYNKKNPALMKVMKEHRSALTTFWRSRGLAILRTLNIVSSNLANKDLLITLSPAMKPELARLTGDKVDTDREALLSVIDSLDFMRKAAFEFKKKHTFTSRLYSESFHYQTMPLSQVCLRNHANIQPAR